MDWERNVERRAMPTGKAMGIEELKDVEVEKSLALKWM